MSMRLPFVLLVVSLWTGPTDAQSHKAWIWDKRDAKEIAKLEKAVTEESGRFHLESESWIIDTEVDARFTAELALFMDRFRTAFDGLLEGLHDGSQVEGKPRIYIWDTKEEYERAEPGGSRGYFRYTYDAQHKMRLTLYSFVDGAEERQFKFFYYPILIHEGAHCLLKSYVGEARLPMWFDEGVATYFQFWDLRASGRQNLKSRHQRSFFRDLMKETYLEAPPSLAELRGVHVWNPDNMGPIANRHYAFAESFTDLLLSSKEGRKVFKTMFQRILTNEPPLPDDELATLETAWHAHIRSRLGLKK
ncbi:MAG: hypothetical protein KDC38_00300 [Planctomycetes bacterium]|nr:hypothetical protein [Planctomycetota bacterium]